MKNNNINLDDLNKILNDFKDKKIVVIGDLMIDHYLWGAVDRISPEAPVPVVDITNEEYRLGGAANVVHNVLSLNAVPIVIGLVGDDTNADVLIDLFKDNNINTDFIYKDNSRPTTVKSRIFASGQQMLRFDQEKRHEISENTERIIKKNIDLALENADALILEDYNKGLLSPNIIRYAIDKANNIGIPVLVDPKFQNFFEYKNCTVFKPNFNELKKNLNIEIHSDSELEKAAYSLLEILNPEYLIITLGEKGLVAFDNQKNVLKIPTFAKEVFDVSGAGDTVISVLTLCLAIGLDIKTSSIIANHAAGAVCGKRGINPVCIDDIILSFKFN